MPLSLQNIGYIVTTTNGLSVRSISSLEREQLPVLTRDCTLAPADVLLTQRSPGQPCSPRCCCSGCRGLKGAVSGSICAHVCGRRKDSTIPVL